MAKAEYENSTRQWNDEGKSDTQDSVKNKYGMFQDICIMIIYSKNLVKLISIQAAPSSTNVLNFIVIKEYTQRSF